MQANREQQHQSSYNAAKNLGRKFLSYDKFSVGKPAMKIEFEGA